MAVYFIGSGEPESPIKVGYAKSVERTDKAIEAVERALEPWEQGAPDYSHLPDDCQEECVCGGLGCRLAAEIRHIALEALK